MPIYYIYYIKYEAVCAFLPDFSCCESRSTPTTCNWGLYSGAGQSTNSIPRKSHILGFFIYQELINGRCSSHPPFLPLQLNPTLSYPQSSQWSVLHRGKLSYRLKQPMDQQYLLHPRICQEAKQGGRHLPYLGYLSWLPGCHVCHKRNILKFNPFRYRWPRRSRRTFEGLLSKQQDDGFLWCRGVPGCYNGKWRFFLPSFLLRIEADF